MNSYAKIIFSATLVTGLISLASSAQTEFNAGNLPLCFEANHEKDATASFIARGRDSEFLMSANSAQFILRQANGHATAARMQFVGANSTAHISGDAELPGKINYFVGDHSDQWRSGVATFSKVRVENIYSGVNLVYYGNGRQLEYDFNLAAGIDPQTIAIRFDGAEKISVNPQGELVVNLNGGEIVQHEPVIYQNSGAARREIIGGYKMLDAHTVTFALGNYDHNLPLVIDPVLSYSTFFGGNNGDDIHAIALDSNGFIYVAGETVSTKFTNAPAGFQTNFQGGTITGDAFVAKFDNSGSNLVYLTYLGGSADDTAYSLAVNGGNAFITGATESPDFPTNNALFGHITGKKLSQGFYLPDVFVTELSSDGAQLVYSTYLGGNGQDIGKGIAVDAAGNAFVVGYTSSTNFPVTASAFQKNLLCTNSLYFNNNAFLTEISPGGAGLNYSSYFGGTNFDEATAIALDASAAIYVTGFTASTNFPSVNPIPGFRHLNGTTDEIPFYDAFVAKFQPGFSSLVYSTFLGGTNNDLASAIAVDGGGNAYVVGATGSTNFPDTTFAVPGLTSFIQTNIYGFFIATNAFLTKIGWNGSNATISYSALFGGLGIDVANGVAVDAAGDAFVVGSASSTNFPVTPGNLIGSLRATNSGFSDAFVTAFNADASALIFSAYLGGNGTGANGSGNDFGNAIALDAAGNAYVAGQTGSTNFPAFAARQNFLAGTNDAFLAKIISAAQPPLITASGNKSQITISWPPVGEETPAQFALQGNTNLLTHHWITITNLPVLTNGVYQFNLTPTNPMEFFRLHPQ